MRVRAQEVLSDDVFEMSVWITVMQVTMDPIVDTVLDIISKCVVASVRPGLEAETTIAGDLHIISQRIQDVDDGICGICLSELLECTGEDVAVMSLREMKCPGSHQFHSQCLRQWLVHSKRGDCPVCRHNFYDSVRKDCEENLEHQIQPCPTASYKCCWSKTYDLRVAAVQILNFCKSSSDVPFSESVASALLWSLSEPDEISELVLGHNNISDAMEVLTPQSVWQYCVSLIKAFDFAQSNESRFMILHGIRAVSINGECGAMLVSLGCFSILLNFLKMSPSDLDDDDEFEFIEMIAFAMYNLVLHEELGPVLLRELFEAFKAADNEHARHRYAAAIYEIAELDRESCIALISGGACTALIEELKTSNTICNQALLTSQKIDCYTYYYYLASAICTLSSSLDGCLALIDAGACDAFVAALRIFRMNVDVEHATVDVQPACNILCTMNIISKQHIGRVALVAADAFPELIGVLKKAGPIIEEYHFSATPGYSYHWNEQIQDTAVILSHLVKNQMGRVELIKSDACGALVEILQNPGVYLDQKHLDRIEYFMVRISRVDDGRMIDALAQGLNVASNVYARSRLSFFIGSLARSSLNLYPLRFVSSRSCYGLVQAFKMAEDNDGRKDIIVTIDILLKNVKESRAALVAAGALGVLKESLEMGLCSPKDCGIADIISVLSEPEKGPPPPQRLINHHTQSHISSHHLCSVSVDAFLVPAESLSSSATPSFAFGAVLPPTAPAFAAFGASTGYMSMTQAPMSSSQRERVEKELKDVEDMLRKHNDRPQQQQQAEEDNNATGTGDDRLVKKRNTSDDV